ncbi:MAG TPA: hypothetical protein VGM77_11100 [Gemmatimonadales bacterium]
MTTPLRKPMTRPMLDALKKALDAMLERPECKGRNVFVGTAKVIGFLCEWNWDGPDEIATEWVDDNLKFLLAQAQAPGMKVCVGDITAMRAKLPA